MKKIYFLLSVSLLLSAKLVAQTTHFSEDFNDGLTGWTSYDMDGDSYNWSTMTLSGTAFDAQGAVAFSESYNSNGALSPNNVMVSPAINLSGATGTISLSYKIGSYRTSYYAENFSVYVTGNISNINTVLSSTPVQTMTISTPQSMPTYTFDISSFAGDNSVYVVFRHHDCTDQYELILDDILVESSGGGGGNGDLKNISAYNGNIETGLDYTLIPNSERMPLTVGCKVANLSATTMSNKTLGVVINDGTSNVYTGNTTFTIAGNDTSYVWITTNYTPAINKTYTMTCTLGSDADNTNNVRTFTFQTQADYYAHDQNPTQTFGTTATGGGYYLVNAFEIPNNATLYSIDVKLAAGTATNLNLRAFLSSSNGYIGEGFRTITSTDISGGQFVRIYLDDPAVLQGGLMHFVGVGSDALTGGLFVSAQTGNDDGASGTLINGAYTIINKTLAIRMNFGQGCVSYDATASATDAPTCNPNIGTIALDITTGGQALSGQNSISWTGPENGSSGVNQSNNYTITGLQAGTYDITVTNNGCSVNIADVVVGSIASPTMSISETTPVSCFGSSDGSITYNVNGNAAGYSFTWEDGSTLQTRTGLSAGTYTISATDGVCAFSQSFTLNQPQEIGIVAVKQNVTTCGGTNGQINLSTSGGTSSTYIYTWTGPATGSSGPGFGSSFTINDLSAGNYTITVTNGSCVNSTVVSISENGAPPVTISESDFVSCAGAQDGALTVSSTTNISSYTFTWSNGGSGTTVSNVGAGNYTVTGTNGVCTTVASYELGQPLPLVVTGSAGVSSISTTVNGGTAAYIYSWTGPGGFTSSAASLSNLTALGTYTVTVTDMNGCTDSQSFTLDFIGIEEAGKTAVKFYPNPAKETINFEVNESVKTIQIMDYTGKLISEIAVKNAVETLSLDGFANGLYFFRLVDQQNKLVLTDRFVVAK